MSSPPFSSIGNNNNTLPLDSFPSSSTASPPISPPSRHGSAEAFSFNSSPILLPKPILAKSTQTPRFILTWWSDAKKVKFQTEKENNNVLVREATNTNDFDPLKVSAVIYGVQVLTEREADYLLSQNIPNWKKILFLMTNLPYIILAFVVIGMERVPNQAWPEAFASMCESSIATSFLSALVATTSLTLHSSQVRVCHWCCNNSRARTCHRRRIQDRLDVADCTCASFACIGMVVCQGFDKMFYQMVFLLPVFVLSLIAKKLSYFNLYLILHGIWHVWSVALVWEAVVPYTISDMIQFFITNLPLAASSNEL